MKIIRFIKDNLPFFSTLLLIVLIPLYPKLPLLDVKNTWVYIRAEDFIVLSVLLTWIVLLIRKKVTLKTPLTIPIMVFWIIGAIATIHGVILIFPTLANVFPNVAFLSYLRHLEYMSVFFIAFSSMQNKRYLPIFIVTIVLTLLLIIGYGFGQKYLGFPAFLTMNEEFAKGIPIQLSQLSRVPSTFAGHYDLAAYLVLILPIIASLIFGFRNWFVKIFLAGVLLLGIVLLFMTVSRVSFFVLFIGLFVVLLFQKRKIVLFSIPIIALCAFLFISLKPALLERFSNTVKEVNVLVDAKTGAAVGHVNYVPAEYFKDKVILQTRVQDKEQLDNALIGEEEKVEEASPSSLLTYEYLPPQVPLVVATNVSTGEHLPQGTGYINLSLSPVTKRLGNFFYELPPDARERASASISAEILVIHGDFIVKRASAYDLSFTTRFQGEWPRALAAFGENILVGSGYGSVSLAVDNNYFRMLGEIGLLGTASFFAIFLALGIYMRKVVPDMESPVARSFVIGFAAGFIGLALNATLIDVFEASKVAFVLWTLTGITLGTLVLYQKKNFDLNNEFKKAITSPYAIIGYLLIGTIVMFSPMLGNFFVGDDFTWFRWAADCGSTNCPPIMERISQYFTDAGGFFYRPGTKVYFLLMYSAFWLNQAMYHIVSISLHFIVTVLFFLLARKILKNSLLSVLASVLFLIMSGYSEMIFWISSTGHLFNAVFALLSLHFFILWEERKNIYFYVASFISIGLGLLFHELGVVIPLLLILYALTFGKYVTIRKLLRSPYYYLLFIPVIGYLIMRYSAESHWFNGDYSYNILKLPFNIVGNIIGYTLITFLGPISSPVYQMLRSILRDHVIIVTIGVVALLIIGVLIYRSLIKVVKNIDKDDKRIVVFGFLFFVIALIPFLGLGNITSRYSYLASLGLILIGVYLIKKLYGYLLSSGREIALTSILVFLSVFGLLHIIQVQQIHVDWHGAGERAKKFLVSIDAIYSDSWSREPISLHFVNVPIRSGEAWVFPVGLSDALWLSFRNPDLRIYTHETVEQALKESENVPTSRVLKFTDDGSVEEVIRIKNKVTPTPKIIQ